MNENNDKRCPLTAMVESELELLHRHVNMLCIIKEHQPIGIIKLSEITKYPQHKVRYSLRMLEKEGLIFPSPNGAMTTVKIDVFISNLMQCTDNIESIVKEIKNSIICSNL